MKEADRCRNFFAWASSSGSTIARWSRRSATSKTKFGKRPEIAEANTAPSRPATTTAKPRRRSHSKYHVAPAKLKPGNYRNITGNQASRSGLITAAKQSGKELFLGSYPITPASDILHDLSR
jgi:2-oxoglutarate ferredoxin oxidoreductase subunit alpha